MAFIVAAPVLDPVFFGALVLIGGVKAVISYVVVAFLAAMSLAAIAELIGIEQHFKNIDTFDTDSSCDAGTGCDAVSSGEGAETWLGLRSESFEAARSAAVLLRTMAPLLLAGIALSLVIEAAVPADVMARLMGAEPRFSIPIAAALGTPLYVSTGVFVPIADSLRGAGVGVGAIVALTIAGAGANVPEFVILSKLAKPKLICAFFTYVFGVAIVGGLLAQAVAAT